MLSVRPMEGKDIDALVSYWFDSSPVYLEGMGVDTSKMPTKSAWREMLETQLHLPIENRRSYCIIWEVDGVSIGHCNTNPTSFGEEAYMHLHLWKSLERQKGLGTAFVRMTVPRFFQDLELKTLYCQPYALNIAPNRTLEKAGFRFIKEYVTVPGFINFEQPVKLWEISKAEALNW